MEKKFYAYAKLNLTLDVLGKMENGYHAMKMVMQSVALCDDVRIRTAEGTGKISVSTNRSFLPCNNKNSAWKAAEQFLLASGITGYDVDIDIFKRIPVCAGMAGGSTDAAAVLRGLNEMFETGFSQEKLEKIGEKIGSDVPYCVAGGTVLAEGRGEKLTELSPLRKCPVVICKPGFPVSTPELFARIDCAKIKCRPDMDGMLAALSEDDLISVGRRVYNVFEDVLPSGKDDIQYIKNKMYDYCALGSAMTGTGSAVFGIFDDEQSAEAAYEDLRRRYDECFLTETVGKIKI